MIDYTNEFKGRKAFITGGSRGIGAATAEEMAETIAFLVSDRASYITGHDHFVTAGYGDLA